jgi:hypothetical protein
MAPWALDGARNPSVLLLPRQGPRLRGHGDDGIVPFMSEEPVAMPMRVDLYNREGVIVANDEWGFEDE